MKEEANNGLKVLRPSNTRLARELQAACSAGRPVLLENLDESLDPLLDPLLLKQT